MLIHDDIFSWKGFGGVFDLASGRCRLRIFDLSRARDGKVMHLKPIVVVVSDLPGDGSNLKRVSVRSCNSHIATCVVSEFNIDPHRMIFLEYYPSSTYGDCQQHYIAAKFDAVEFEWHEQKALHPKWKSLDQPMLKVVSELLGDAE